MIPTLLWWLAIQLFGLAVLPLAWRLFARLPGRGYPFAKSLGLLLLCFMLWLGASFHLLPNNAGGIAVALLVVAGVSWWLGRDGWRRDAEGVRPLLAWLRASRWLVLATELLFLGVLAGWAAFRASNPDIAGTEKPMEFAFINGVLRSRLFPPQDPWLSGYGISYYYFGYVMLATLTRLTGVAPAVGFNLGVALWYALVMVGAFGVGYDLVQLRKASWERREGSQGNSGGTGRGIGFGLLGALFVGFLGNLEGLVEVAYNRSLVPASWIRWLDIKQLTDSPPTGTLTGGFWWWWRASRVIHDKDLLGNSVEVIDEFPFFSFLLGDMHPHVLAFPFAILAVALALNLFLGARSWTARSSGVEAGSAEHAPRAAGLRSRITHHVSRLWCMLGEATGAGTPGIMLYALALGGLAFLNTWDFPIYVGLATLALGVGWALSEGLSWGVAGRAIASGAILAVLGWLLYLPFYLGFQSQLGGMLPNLLFPTRFSQYFLMFGPFLVVVICFLVLVGREVSGHRTLRGFLVALIGTVLIPLLVLAAVVLGLAVMPQGKALIQDLLNNPAVQANVGDRTLGGLLGLVVRLRVSTPWTYLVLAALIAWAVGLLWACLSRGAEEQGSGEVLREERRSGGAEAPDFSSAPHPLISSSPLRPVAEDLFAVVMIALALALTLVPEFVYLRDLFGTRMNTVFKFYYQAWLLLALASAYGLSRLAERGTARWLKLPALLVAGVLILVGLWYPLAAIPSKADTFRVDRASGDPRPTLDGLAHLRRFNPADVAAIEWIRQSVAPEAVVLEATGGSYSPEGAGRISMSTGNPTLLGWDFHERQWRGNAGYDRLAAGRPDAITQIYRTARPEELPGLLDQWGVDYVYIGGLERNRYGIGDAALARFDRVLNLVYDEDGVRIYAR